MYFVSFETSSFDDDNDTVTYQEKRCAIFKKMNIYMFALCYIYSGA